MQQAEQAQGEHADYIRRVESRKRSVYDMVGLHPARDLPKSPQQPKPVSPRPAGHYLLGNPIFAIPFPTIFDRTGCQDPNGGAPAHEGLGHRAQRGYPPIDPRGLHPGRDQKDIHLTFRYWTSMVSPKKRVTEFALSRW